MFLYSFIDVHYTNLTLSALNVHAGAYIQYDAGLGDDLSKDGTQALVDESESIMPFPEDQEDSDDWLKPIPIASPAALIGNARPPRQMWTPFYLFLIRNVLSKLNPWSTYLNPSAHSDAAEKFRRFSEEKYKVYAPPGQEAQAVERRMSRFGLRTVALWDSLIYSAAFGESFEGAFDATEQHIYVEKRIEELVSMHSSWWKATLPPARKNMKLLDLWKDMYKVHCIEGPTAAMRSAHYDVLDERARINLLLDEAE